jgi:putative methionine-R-sulfoxide reductase with GAF domain
VTIRSERLGSAEERLRAIEAVTDRRLEKLDVDDLLAALLDRVAALLAADTAAVLLLDKTGHELVARAACGIEEEVRQGVRVPVGMGFAGKIAAQRRPVAIDRVDETTVWNPILWRKGIRTMLGVPLERGAELLGVLHVGRLSARPFTEEDTALLQVVASRVAGAVQARELEVERSAAKLLQRSLLPAALPECPGIRFASRYVPAQVGGVGGDWYDAFILPNGDLWVMVGDVAGHGLAAAVVMGRVRSALRAYALLGEPPAAVLAMADRKVQLFEPEVTVTALCARLVPPYREAMVASCGHLPPVIARPGEPAQFVELAVSPPLGVTATMQPRSTSVRLDAGSVLLAYTDGLVERRHEPLDDGLERLLAAVPVGDPETVCRTVMDALVGDSISSDDIAVIALQRQ